MLTRQDLRKLATERLKDAQSLCAAGRFDAAVYLCGYVVEMALKACICRRLRVRNYPESEFHGKLKSHDYDELFLLAGLREDKVYRNNLLAWSAVLGWKPESRYERFGKVTRQDAEDRIRVLKQEVLPWLKKRW